MRDGADAAIIRRGADFWDHALKSSPEPEALEGFGAWAGVAELDQNRWEILTLRTCEITNGKLEWAWQVSQRINSSETITDAGLRIMALMVQADLDGTSRHQVEEDAPEILAKSKDRTDVQESWNRLHDEMMHRGHYEVGEL